LLGDCHWADGASLALLNFLSRRVTQHAISLLAACRTESNGDDLPPGVALLGRLQAKPVSTRELELPETGTVRDPDTRLIDGQGNFDEARLDALFREHGKRFAGEALTVSEIARMLGATLVSCAHRSLKDALLMPTGIVAVAVEWGALLWVAGEQRDGVPVLEKSAVYAFYTDPHFFDFVAERLAKLRAERASTSLGRVRNFVQRWLA
jgi:hypothetical protein